MQIEDVSTTRRWGIVLAALAAGLAHTAIEVGIDQLPITSPFIARLADILLVWAIVVGLAVLASRQANLAGALLARQQDAHRAARAEVERLDVQNQLLRSIAEAADVRLTLRPIAQHLRQLVFCDQVGLALPCEGGQVFETFSARVDAEERRARPRLELEFQAKASLIGAVVARGEARVVDDLSEIGPDLLDANFWLSSGFRSAAVLPLMARDRRFGALFVAARRPAAFTPADVRALQPLAEVLGVAFTAQQLHLALARQQMAQAMAEETLADANEINSALQTIIGHCDLIERAATDPLLQRDLATVVKQAQRIEALLEQMRHHAQARVRAATVSAQEATAAAVPAEGPSSAAPTS